MKTRNSMLNRGNYGAKFEESDRHILTGMEVIVVAVLERVWGIGGSSRLVGLRSCTIENMQLHCVKYNFIITFIFHTQYI